VRAGITSASEAEPGDRHEDRRKPPALRRRQRRDGDLRRVSNDARSSILAEVRKALPRDALITTYVGWNKNGVGQQFPIYTPGSVLTPGGYATMGFGPPAAIGAKLARPDRVVLSLVGDGGFGQNPAALATAVEEKLAVIWLVMNNNAYGTIGGLQKSAYGLSTRHFVPDRRGRLGRTKAKLCRHRPRLRLRG
jgi:acetolactate synthase-1/2/3 large subunit